MSTSCAYRMGYSYKELPRGIKTLNVPIFKNDTLDIGPEKAFTNYLIQELKRADVATVLSSNTRAEGVLKGRIIRITRINRTPEQRGIGEVKTKGMVNLPEGTRFDTETLLKITVEILLVNSKTEKVVWKQWFEDEMFYPKARLALEGINTSSSNYTDSEDKRVIKLLASVMMQEAVGRLTENF